MLVQINVINNIIHCGSFRYYSKNRDDGSKQTRFYYICMVIDVDDF